MENDDVSLLVEELVKLSVKSSKLVPSGAATLLCTIWTRKTYNLNTLKVQLRSLWKTKQKFDVKEAGSNMFLIHFESEEDIEVVLEGWAWLFRRYLIVFEHLMESKNRDNIRLISSPFWIKVDPCPIKCDRKDLINAISSTFGGLIRPKSKDEYYRLRVNLDITKPLKRGIFVSTNAHDKLWITFKYEKLPSFCYTGRKMAHGLKECLDLLHESVKIIKKDLPYSGALKAESILMGKEWYKFNRSSNKSIPQHSYTGRAHIEKM